jgi:RimJ/RimL family protein N-acetyltransferase
MARILPRNVHLKNGREVVIRCGEEKDVLALLDGVKNVLLDGEGMLLEADEFSKTEAEERGWIKSLNENPQELLLVAEAEDKIVGTLDFHIAKRRRLSHSGSLGMSVQPGWRNCGVGNALLESLLQWARSVPEIEKINLNVRADNDRGIALYKKHGFVQTGCAKDAVKLGQFNFVDELSMEVFVRS